MRMIKNIIKGWAKAFGLLPVSEAEKKLSVLRLKECGKCEFSKSSQVLEIVNDKANYENRLVCTRCGCPCLEKSLVVDEFCPEGKW